MGDWPVGELTEGLLRLTRNGARRVDVPAPITFMTQACPLLLDLVPGILLPATPTLRDRVESAQRLLERVAFRSENAEVRAIGDLLGLTDLPPDQVRQEYENYRHSDTHTSDSPKKFARYRREIRKIMAVRHFGMGLSWLDYPLEATFMGKFVKELCSYLDNEDDKLADLARDLGYLPLVEVDSTGTSAMSDAPLLALSATDYVHRRQIETQFNTLVEQGAELIAFVGFPGMGKSSLARALTDGSPFIEFQDGGPSVAHLQAALERYRPNKEATVTSENAEALLATLLSTKPGPRFVVLDNLHSTNELRTLVSPGIATIVVATCRQSGESPPSWCNEVQVDTMTKGEAAQLVKRLSPSLSDGDTAFVAETLDGYPLIIEAVCGYTNVTGLNVQDLCRSLQIEPGHVRTKADEKLRDIVELMMLRLRESEPVAIELLACLVSFDEPSEYYFTDPLYGFVREHYGADVAPTKYAAAIKTLRDMYLARFRQWDYPDDDGSPHTGIYMSVHPLIKSILLDTLRQDVLRVDAMLYECLERLMKQVRLRMERPSDRPLEPESETLPAKILGLSSLLQRTSAPLEIEEAQYFGDNDTAEARRGWYLFELTRRFLESSQEVNADDRMWIARNVALHEVRRRRNAPPGRRP